MKNHQIGLIAGLQAVFDEFASMMNPDRYTAESGQGVQSLLRSATQKSRNWDQFCAFCERMDADSASGVSGHFSDVFAKAYEERTRLLGELNPGGP